MSEFGDVTLVIPQWNRADLLRTLLEHLAAQSYPIFQTIVVDNGSTDDSAAVARQFGAKVIEMRRNAGFAPAVNRGIEASTTDWVAIVNNDVTLEPDWLVRLLRAATETGAWFATGKMLKIADPRMIDATFDLVCAGGTAWRSGEGRPDGPCWSEQRSIQFAPLTAAVFQRRLFDAVGLLDERFESYLEDIELGLRCAGCSLAGVYVPSARGTHQGSATRGAWHSATVGQIARNQLFIRFMHFRGAPRWPALVAQLLWGMLALRRGEAGAWVAGVCEAFRRIGEVRGNRGGWSRIRKAVEASERELLDYQRRTGFDTYWRWYFMLTRGDVR